MELYDNFEVNLMDGNLERGGWTVQGNLLDDLTGLVFGQNVALHGQNLSGGIADPQYKQYFNGHCFTGVSGYSVQKWSSRGTIRLGTADNLLKGYLQDIAFTESASPQHGHQITDLRIAKAVEHIMRDHCNVIFDPVKTPNGIVPSVDVDTAGSVKRETFIVRKSNNFWRRIQEMGGGNKAGEFYYPYFTRDNVFHHRLNPFASSPTSKGTLTNNHITGPLRIQFTDANPLNRVGQVDLYTVMVGSENFYNSVYPNPQDGGKRHILGTGVWADSQVRSDAMAQQLYEWLTRPYTLFVPVDPCLLLFGDDGKGLDLAEAVHVDYDGQVDDGGNGFNFQIDTDGYIYGATLRFDSANDKANCILRLECKP